LQQLPDARVDGKRQATFVGDSFDPHRVRVNRGSSSVGHVGLQQGQAGGLRVFLTLSFGIRSHHKLNWAFAALDLEEMENEELERECSLAMAVARYDCRAEGSEQSGQNASVRDG
jgi:hypothetical protein